MLIEFRVENHRSIRDEQALTLEAGHVGDADDPRPRKVEGHDKELLPVAALYGANASGKSNVLDAMRFMRDAVLSSNRYWPPEGGTPQEPFAWGPKSREPSLYEVTFLIGQVRHHYGFVADDQRFLEEWLHVWPKGHKQIWFERDADKFKFGEQLAGENKLVQEITRPNALFLSAAAQLYHSQLTPIYTWFLGLLTVNVSEDPWRTTHRWSVPRVVNRWSFGRLDDLIEAGRLEGLHELLRDADLGIVAVKRDESSPRVMVQHRSATGEAWLPLNQESQGTQTLFRIAPTLLEVLSKGGVMVVDELEASLHPLLALNLVRRFNDPATNPHHAQLLFTTHDTHLLGNVLGEPALRRDQVWLTEKDPEGATCLYPLTDYKPRKAENLERGYLQGRYGAIPFLGVPLPAEPEDG